MSRMIDIENSFDKSVISIMLIISKEIFFKHVTAINKVIGSLLDHQMGGVSNYFH